jgi:hypothetical protein
MIAHLRSLVLLEDSVHSYFPLTEWNRRSMGPYRFCELGATYLEIIRQATSTSTVVGEEEIRDESYTRPRIQKQSPLSRLHDD